MVFSALSGSAPNNPPSPISRPWTARAATSCNWDDYDTRHAVFQPAKHTPEALKKGYDSRLS